MGMKFFFDIGILLSAFSFMFINRGLEFNLINLTISISIFFLFIGLWFFAKNAKIASNIKRDIEGKEPPQNLAEFIRVSTGDILNCVLIGMLLSITASLLAMSSHLDIMLSPAYNIGLIVIFISTMFFSIYLMTKLLSHEGRSSI